jgi:sugar fermentation stimulation protein A
LEALLRVDVVPCRFLERINRFTVAVDVGGRRELAHLTNTGRLTGVLSDNRDCLLQRINGRKTRFRIVGVRTGGDYALIDTLLQSRAFEKLVERRLLPSLEDCEVAARSPRFEGSVFDYLLRCGTRTYIVELKSAVMIGPNREALYPDCPTERGRRHIKTLMEIPGRTAGARPLIFMVAAFREAACFMPSRLGDPVVFDLLSSWVARGLDLRAASLYIDGGGFVLLEKPELPLCRAWLSEIGLS